MRPSYRKNQSPLERHTSRKISSLKTLDQWQHASVYYQTKQMLNIENLQMQQGNVKLSVMEFTWKHTRHKTFASRMSFLVCNYEEYYRLINRPSACSVNLYYHLRLTAIQYQSHSTTPTIILGILARLEIDGGRHKIHWIWMSQNSSNCFQPCGVSETMVSLIGVCCEA